MTCINVPLVYDITVADAHVFYAGGYLVHNCYVCDSNESDGSVPIGQAFASGDTQPPAHTRCRCCLVPDDVLGSPLPY